MRYFFVTALAAVSIAFCTPVQSKADFTVTFSDGSGSSVSIDWDTQMVTAVSGTTNATVGTFASQSGVTIARGTAPPGFTETIRVLGLTLDNLYLDSSVSNSNTPGSLRVGQISLGGLNISNTGAATTLTVNEQSTGFTHPQEPILAVITHGDILADAGISATYTSQVNGTDINSVTIPPNSNSPVTSYISNPGTPFTIGGVLVVDLTANSNVTDLSTSTQIVAPAPSSIVLAAFGSFSMLGYVRFKRRRADDSL